LGGGHYTAYAKNNQNWIKFDDSRLKPVEKREDIVSPEAFLLFYQRK
jgi:ubiquitin C-terminal hydrolase